MYIDQTRYEAFWSNPEKYRLTYEVNLVPDEMNFYLARGIAFHLMTEGQLRGWSQADIYAMFSEKSKDIRAWESAKKLFDAYAARYVGSNVILKDVEMEFNYHIPGSQHHMVGKIDQLLEIDGELWVGETKTNNGRKSYKQFTEEWTRKKQADFELVGAESLGLNVAGVLMRVIRDVSPVDIWEIPIRLNGPGEVRRTSQGLEVTKLEVHQTCETIEMYRRTFGIIHPWPHLNQYPCNGGNGRCEYETICGRSLPEIPLVDLQAFKQREEHLDIMQQNFPPTRFESIVGTIAPGSEYEEIFEETAA